jgi:serine/threonine kinase 38
MLVGHPPFYADEPSTTCQKILHWKKTFNIPPEAKLSKNAKDLLLKMVTDAENRLGRNGADEIKSHPFFNGFDW